MKLSARDTLINLSQKCEGDIDKILQDIYTKKSEFDVAPKLPKGVKAVTLVDLEFPQRLKQCCKPPVVLYYKGDLSLLNNDNIISVVGTKKPSPACDYAAELFFGKNKDMMTVTSVSGDTDSKIIDLVNKPIVVLGCGIDYSDGYADVIVNKVLDKGGLVLSEYPDNTLPSKQACMMRSRIIEAIASKTLVLEIHHNSSTISRIVFSQNLGHDIFVVPKDLCYEKEYMNNTLISEGAIICTSIDDLNA